MPAKKDTAKKYASILNCLVPDFSDAKKWGKVSEVLGDMVLDIEDRLDDMKRSKSSKYFEDEAEEGEEDELEEDAEEEKNNTEEPKKKACNTVMTQFFEKKFHDKEADASNMRTGVEEIDRYYDIAKETTNKKSLKKMLKNMQKIAVYTNRAADGGVKCKKRKREEEEEGEEEDDEVTREELEEELADLTNNEPKEGKGEIFYDCIDSSEDESSDKEEED